MAPPTKASLADLRKELSEVIGQLQVLEERQRIADNLDVRIAQLEVKVSAILRQDLNAMNSFGMAGG